MTPTSAEDVAMSRPSSSVRVDHIVLLYASRTNQEAAQAQLADALGVDDWHDHGVIDGQVREIVSDSGLHLWSPTQHVEELDKHLATYGEGFYKLCCTVDRRPSPRHWEAQDGPATSRASVAGIALEVAEKTTKSAPRNTTHPSAGRIDHLVFHYPSLEARNVARDEFATALDIDDWMDLGAVNDTFFVTVSWSSGIELISPIEPNSVAPPPAVNPFHALVFGVPDLPRAVSVARQQGRTVVELPPPPDLVFEIFSTAREATLGEVGAITVLFGEFTPR